MRKNFRDAIKSKTSAWPVLDESSNVVVLTSDRRFFAAFKRKFRGKAELVLLNPETLSDAGAEIQKAERTLAIYYPREASPQIGWLNSARTCARKLWS